MTSISKQVSESLTYLQNVQNDITKLYKAKYDARPSYERWSYTALDIIWKVGAIAREIARKII
jgi:di/tripeptidase